MPPGVGEAVIRLHDGTEFRGFVESLNVEQNAVRLETVAGRAVSIPTGLDAEIRVFNLRQIGPPVEEDSEPVSPKPTDYDSNPDWGNF